MGDIAIWCRNDMTVCVVCLNRTILTTTTQRKNTSDPNMIFCPIWMRGARKVMNVPRVAINADTFKTTEWLT